MVEKLFHCEICRSKVLESRLKKHHAKVHANIDHNIYKPLSDIASSIVASEMSPKANIEPANNQPAPIINSVWGIEMPKDDGNMHVQCGICRNKMPAADLNAHMKRKHSEPMDQVDAIGRMVDGQSPDAFKTFNSFVAKSMYEQSDSSIVDKLQPPNTPKKDSIDFGLTFKPTNQTTNLEQIFAPPADFGPSKAETFYTIRITEGQMQDFLNNKRIYPKNGAFYLK